MLPFDLDVVFGPPVLARSGAAIAPILPPVVADFDPDQESLTFSLSEKDADRVLRLRDLDDGSGVRVEVGDRLLVTLMGCVADDIPETCLTFEFDD